MFTCMYVAALMQIFLPYLIKIAFSSASMDIEAFGFGGRRRSRRLFPVSSFRRSRADDHVEETRR